MQYCKSALVLVAWGLAGAAHSAFAIPANDNWADALVVPPITASTPFTTTETDVRSATTEQTDPVIQCQVTYSKNPGQQYHSLWYSYTTGTSVEYVNLSAAGNTYQSGTDISVYTGTQGALHMLSGGCVESSASPGLLNGLRLQPLTTYFFEIVSTTLLSASDTSTDQLNFSASAAPIYNVGRTDDPVDTNLPVCAANDPDPAANCSIRSALNAANLVPGAILVPAGTYAMTDVSTAEDLNVDGDFDLLVSMGIYGAGRGQTTVVAPLNDRVFDLPNGASATTTLRGSVVLADMTLQGPGNLGTFTGSGALVRDNTLNGGYFMALQGMELGHGYTASPAAAGNGGGGFASIGRGHIRDSYIHDNTASNGGGVLLMFVSPYNLFEISSTLIANNTATSTSTSSTSSPIGGGGIMAYPGLRLQNSTVSGNTAVGFGGGLFVARTSIAEIRNSTITANVAQTASGGGGLRRDNSGSGTTPLTMIYNSILSGNSSNSAALTPDDCNGLTPASRFVTARNIVGALAVGSTCGFSAASPSNDQIGVDPNLGPLADNGGLTRTHALLAGSPAIDAGNTDAVAFPLGLCGNDFSGFSVTTPSPYTFPGVTLPYDQRGPGFARILDGGTGTARCDIGAYEAPTPGPAAGTPVLAVVSDGGVQGDNLTNVTQPGFTGTCTTGDMVQIAVNAVVDSAAMGTCANGAYALTLGSALSPDGVFQITAVTTRSGATLPVSSALALDIDSTAPVLTLDGPSGTVSSSSATFTFSANEAVGDFSCTLDGNPLAACASPVDFSGLTGSHAFAVQATDTAGNSGNATGAWTIDAPPTQWSTDPSDNLTIADRGGEQNQSKIAATADGGFYVSWFDNTSDGNNSGGYSVYLQRVDAFGKELWPHDGVLVAARSLGYTYDYGLAVDSAGNAVLAFNCCHNNDPDEHIVVSKVSPTGTLLWNAPDGIRVTPAGSPRPFSAKVAATSDGDTVVMWSIQNVAKTALEVHAQKFDANGTALWSPEVVVASTGNNFIADIHGSDNGGVILSWGSQPSWGNNQLWAQKLSSTGQPLWGSSVVISGPGTWVLQTGNFPPFITDDAGGAVFSWYVTSISGARVRVQHVNAAGMQLLAANGLEVTTDTATNSHTNPSSSYDPASGDIYTVWRVVDSSTQSNVGINAQRIDSGGYLRWGGGAGIVLVPQASNVDQGMTMALPAAGGFVAEWVSGNVTDSNPISVARLDADGNYVWPAQVVQIKTAPTSTGYLAGALSSAGYAAYTWSDDSPSKIKVQGLMIDDASLGFSDSIFADGFEQP